MQNIDLPTLSHISKYKEEGLNLTCSNCFRNSWNLSITNASIYLKCACDYEANIFSIPATISDEYQLFAIDLQNNSIEVGSRKLQLCL
jgi:hypothetical protein